MWRSLICLDKEILDRIIGLKGLVCSAFKGTVRRGIGDSIDISLRNFAVRRSKRIVW